MNNALPPALRADVQAEVEGKALTFTLDMRTLCEIEESTGNPPLREIVQLVSLDALNMSMVKMRHVIWCGLRVNHPDATLAQAGQFMQAAPNALVDALARFLPDPGDQEGDAGDEAPPQGKKKAAR